MQFQSFNKSQWKCVWNLYVCKNFNINEAFWINICLPDFQMWCFTILCTSVSRYEPSESPIDRMSSDFRLTSGGNFRPENISDVAYIFSTISFIDEVSNRRTKSCSCLRLFCELIRCKLFLFIQKWEMNFYICYL